MKLYSALILAIQVILRYVDGNLTGLNKFLMFHLYHMQKKLAETDKKKKVFLQSYMSKKIRWHKSVDLY